VSKEFSRASARAAYEAGYSGFWLHRKLVAAGINCIVVHAASIEVSSRDTVISMAITAPGAEQIIRPDGPLWSHAALGAATKCHFARQNRRHAAGH